MRILLLTPGTGHFFCGSCLRDDALRRALTGLGHDVTVAPLYLPLVLEEPEGELPVHMGGINMYLQQKSPGLARWMPRWLTDRLDHPGVLRWAARRGSMTEARDLGEMTLSMLRGEEGQQSLEVEKLVTWAAATNPRPDVIVLSNVMLSGIARRLRQELPGTAIVATLQGEAPFLDGLPEPFAGQAWRTLIERTADLDAMIAVSHYYAEHMRQKLQLPAERIQVVHNGIDPRDFPKTPRPLAERTPPTIGFLARMCEDKGLGRLVQAFAQLKRRGSVEGLRLHVAGVMLREDQTYVDRMRRTLQDASCLDDAQFSPNITRAEKLAFLSSCRALSVPSTCGEAFGLFVLEALAAGVPVVQPQHGAFPELIEATRGGLLCAADDPKGEALADALEQLFLDPPRAQDLADHGHRAVHARFSAERMAEEFAAVCSMAARVQSTQSRISHEPCPTPPPRRSSG
ncbi:MAG: glycosyltransferase family 4 protein [Planctomycetota bacterium]